MWISRYKYERIIARLDELETATRVPGPGYGLHIGAVLYLLMEHLKVYPWVTPQRTEIKQKGGPEHG